MNASNNQREQRVLPGWVRGERSIYGDEYITEHNGQVTVEEIQDDGQVIERTLDSGGEQFAEGEFVLIGHMALDGGEEIQLVPVESTYNTHRHA